MMGSTYSPGMTALRSRGGFNPRERRSGDSTYGSLEELKGMAETPDDLARIHQDADGRFYLPDAPNPVASLTGVGADMANARAHQRLALAPAGSKASDQHMAMMAKYGVNFGPMWGDIADLNRGRRATGAAPEHDPVGELAGAARAGAATANRMGAEMAQGAAVAGARDQAVRDYGLRLMSNGVDTERMRTTMGDDWTSADPSAFLYSQPKPMASLRARRR